MPTTRTTSTNHKQNNNMLKQDIHAYKLAPEKLVIKLTNLYNQLTTMEYKCYHMIDSSPTNTQESTQNETQEIKYFGWAYSTERQTTNKFTINQWDYKSVLIIKTNNHSISTFLTLFFLLSSLFCSMACSRR
jgi:hypothetical protein